jgi:gamma-glutamylcyclotransferase (GGCT)/AIG2-like uncharacterized protein YtfP
MSYLFVYGTLRNDARHSVAQHLSHGARLVGTGYIQAKLFDLGEYPGAVPSSSARDKVYGQIFEILEESLLTTLDDYEGCGPRDSVPFEFRREQIPIISRNSNVRNAWGYFYNWPVGKNPLIRTGDYLKAS